MTMTKPSFVYVTYIATTPEKVWQALVDTDLMRQYWVRPDSELRAGERVGLEARLAWEHRRARRHAARSTSSARCSRASRLVAWCSRGPGRTKPATIRSIRVCPSTSNLTSTALVRLTVTHEDLERDPQMLEGISTGWPMVLSNLKTLLETGRVLPRARVAT